MSKKKISVPHFALVMLSKTKIMHQWREFVRQRDHMTKMYVLETTADETDDVLSNI